VGERNLSHKKGAGMNTGISFTEKVCPTCGTPLKKDYETVRMYFSWESGSLEEEVKAVLACEKCGYKEDLDEDEIYC